VGGWDRASWAAARAVITVVGGDGEAEVVALAVELEDRERAALVVSSSDFALTVESRSGCLQPWAKKRANACSCLEKDVWGWHLLCHAVMQRIWVLVVRKLAEPRLKGMTSAKQMRSLQIGT